MFEFQNFVVYKKSKDLCLKVNQLVEKNSENKELLHLKNQSCNILMHIAQSSAMKKTEHKIELLMNSKKNIFECVALIDCLKELKHINEQTHEFFQNKLNELNNIVFNVCKKLENSNKASG